MLANAGCVEILGRRSRGEAIEVVEVVAGWTAVSLDSRNAWGSRICGRVKVRLVSILDMYW